MTRLKDVDSSTVSWHKIIMLILIVLSFRLLFMQEIEPDFTLTKLGRSQEKIFARDSKSVIESAESNNKFDQTSPLHLYWYQLHMIYEESSQTYHENLDESRKSRTLTSIDNDEESEFVRICYESLTSREATRDGYINTHDVYNFVSTVDSTTHDDTTYDGINIFIQIEWIRTLCAESWEDVKCFQRLETMMIQKGFYGFQLQQSSQDQIFEQVYDFCWRIFPILETNEQQLTTSTGSPSMITPGEIPSSDDISSLPSATPSLYGIPNQTPSQSPSKSNIPSQKTSQTPSWTSRPSNLPTLEPSISSIPSFLLSQIPSSIVLPETQTLRSPTPSQSPSKSNIPSQTPSQTPSWTSRPSNLPTLEPSISSIPSFLPSQIPSSTMFPTGGPSYMPSVATNPKVTKVAFHYILGFVDTGINSSQFLSDSNGSRSSVEEAIQNILSGSGLDSNLRRKLRQEPNSRVDDKIVNTLRAQDVDCPSVFSVSTFCILVESVVSIRIKEETNDDTMNQKMVLDPIQKSMESPLFLKTVNRQDMKEVLFVDTPLEVKYQKSNFRTIVGIALGSSIGSILFVLIYFVSRQRRGTARKDGSEFLHESISEGENKRNLKVMNFPFKINDQDIFAQSLPIQRENNDRNKDKLIDLSILNLGGNYLLSLKNERVGGFSDSQSSSSSSSSGHDGINESPTTICGLVVNMSSSSFDLSSISTEDLKEVKGKSLMKSSDLEEAIDRGDWEALEREARVIVDCTPLKVHDTNLLQNQVFETGVSLAASSSEISSLREGGNLKDSKRWSLSQKSSVIVSVDEDLTLSDDDDIDSTRFAAIEKMIDDDDLIGLINHASLSFKKSQT